MQIEIARIVLFVAGSSLIILAVLGCIEWGYKQGYRQGWNEADRVTTHYVIETLRQIRKEREDEENRTDNQR